MQHTLRNARRARSIVLAMTIGIAVVVIAPGGSSSVGAAVPPSYTAVTPDRLMDTRENLGGPIMTAGVSRSLQVAGRGGVPATGAIAVVLNVTVTQPAAAGFVTVWPAGVGRPVASNLNMVAGATAPNLVTVGLGAGGQVDLFSSTDAHLVVDVVGWYASGLVPVTPGRLMDTRDGLGGFVLEPGETRDLQIAGREGVPVSGASAVALNVTVVDPTGAGFLTVWPSGDRPTASNLNFVARQTVANAVLVGLGADGKVRLFNSSGRTHLVVDVAGWFESGFSPAVPERLMDTRDGLGGQVLGPGETRDLVVVGRSGVPSAGVAAVALNVTATRPSGSPYITVWPAGVARPKASNLNVVAGQTVPNAVVVGVGSDGKISLFNSTGSTELIVDVTGWYPTPSTTDLVAPVISAVTAGNITSTSATITWSTDEPATGRADHGATTSYGSSTALASGLTTSHSRTITGLQPSTTYHARVRSSDASGNERVSGDVIFTTSSGPLSFAAAVGYPSGRHAHGVAAVNVTGSSAIDLVVANSQDGTVSVLTGAGNGSFGPPTTYPVGTEPKAVMAGQLNPGGVLDLVTADQGSGTVSVLLGNGTGGFAATVSYAACTGAHEPALADLDGDSDIDIAVACWGSTSIRVLANNGSGVFASAATPVSGSAPHSVVAIDADDDGDSDLAVANHGANTVTIMRNDGAMNFVPQTAIGVGGAPHSIRSADIDDDGDADLVTANDTGIGVSVLLRNAGPLSFGRTDFATGPAAKSVAIADMNGDGNLDVITANINGNYPDPPVVDSGVNAVSILLGNGDGTLQAPVHLADPGTPFGVISADVNADDLPDLVTANWHGGSVAVLRRQP